MGALRKAGVWLGLIEDEDDRGYDDRDYRDSGYRGSGYADEFAEDDEETEPAGRGMAQHRPRGLDHADHAERRGFVDRGHSERGNGDRLTDRDAHREPTRLERAAGVRSITRSTGSNPVVSAGGGYPTRDNLALAPQVQLRERAVLAEEEDQRYQITTLHPTTYREARTIGEHFRDGVPVIINLTEMDEADARRLVDFAAGLAFGLRGTIERVTNRVFLLSPANVQVTAEDKAKIAEGGFFDQS
jgi:cell division inhibitor SepF